jgi:hypothetical protein
LRPHCQRQRRSSTAEQSEEMSSLHDYPRRVIKCGRAIGYLRTLTQVAVANFPTAVELWNLFAPFVPPARGMRPVQSRPTNSRLHTRRAMLRERDKERENPTRHEPNGGSFGR